MTAVTVVVVSDHRTDQDPLEDPMSVRAMASVHSVEHQTFRDFDLSIVRRVDETPVLRLWQWAAQHCETEWVCFMDEGDVWPSEMLAHLVDGVGRDTGCVVSIPPAKGQIVRRDFFLGLYSDAAS